jgi:hypothetical protein
LTRQVAAASTSSDTSSSFSANKKTKPQSELDVLLRFAPPTLLSRWADSLQRLSLRHPNAHDTVAALVAAAPQWTALQSLTLHLTPSPNKALMRALQQWLQPAGLPALSSLTLRRLDKLLSVSTLEAAAAELDSDSDEEDDDNSGSSSATGGAGGVGLAGATNATNTLSLAASATNAFAFGGPKL